MVEAGGVGIFMRIENTQVIDFSTSQKRRIRQNCAQLERTWNARFSASCPILRGNRFSDEYVIRPSDFWLPSQLPRSAFIVTYLENRCKLTLDECIALFPTVEIFQAAWF
jgi:hypothetical protein